MIANIIIGMNGAIGPVLLMPTTCEPAPLEHRDDDAERRPDRQQVHDHRLERDEHAAEHHEQEQEAERQDCADEERQPVPRGVEQSSMVAAVRPPTCTTTWARR